MINTLAVYAAAITLPLGKIFVVVAPIWAIITVWNTEDDQKI